MSDLQPLIAASAGIDDDRYQDFIGRFDGQISPETCQGLIALFNDAHKRKLTHEGRTGLRVMKKRKDSVDLSSNRITDVLQKKYGAHIQAFFDQLSAAHQEYLHRFPGLQDPSTHPHGVWEFNIQRYYPGGQAYHSWHYESAAPQASDRLLAWMSYLNDVDEGGETEFLYQEIKMQPREGRTLIWPAGFTHTHRGLPAKSGVKFIITGWFRFAR